MRRFITLFILGCKYRIATQKPFYPIITAKWALHHIRVEKGLADAIILHLQERIQER